MQMLEIIVYEDPIPSRLLLNHHSTRTAVPAWRSDTIRRAKPFPRLRQRLGILVLLPYRNSPLQEAISFEMEFFGTLALYFGLIAVSGLLSAVHVSWAYRGRNHGTNSSATVVAFSSPSLSKITPVKKTPRSNTVVSEQGHHIQRAFTSIKDEPDKEAVPKQIDTTPMRSYAFGDKKRA
jgi:hypothetical protein